MEEENKVKVINLNPLSKWKRILLFLGDYAITFILSFIFFNLAVFPLGKLICQTEKQSLKAVEYQEKANDLLIEGGLIFDDSIRDDNFENDVNYTFKVFLSYYAFDSEESPDKSNPQYGHKAENEVIRNYFLNHLHNEADYLAAFKDVNSKDNMFDIGETAYDISLKKDYKLLLGSELLEISDESQYSTQMTNLRDHVFARLFYIYIYQNDILENDFVINDRSYLGYLNNSKKIYENLNWVPVVCSFISVVLSWAGVFLIYPMINEERRTPTGSVMKSNSLSFKRLSAIDRKIVGIQSFYSLILNLSIMIFLPVLFFGLPYCFNLPLLFIFMVISFSLMLVSLFFVLFNEHNRSGSDILTSTVIVPASELDELYKNE